MALGLDPGVVDMESLMSGMGSMFASSGRGAASGDQRQRGSGAPQGEARGGRPGGDASEAEREEFMERMRSNRGGGNPFGRGGRGGRGFGAGQGQRESSGEVRTQQAVVFVVAEEGAVEPRMVMIGLTDWDHTQVVSGLDEGDYVAIIGGARLQAERDEMLERMRGRMGGNPFGGGMPGGMGGRGGYRR